MEAQLSIKPPTLPQVGHGALPASVRKGRRSGHWSARLKSLDEGAVGGSISVGGWSVCVVKLFSLLRPPDSQILWLGERSFLERVCVYVCMCTYALCECVCVLRLNYLIFLYLQ